MRSLPSERVMASNWPCSFNSEPQQGLLSKKGRSIKHFPYSVAVPDTYLTSKLGGGSEIIGGTNANIEGMVIRKDIYTIATVNLIKIAFQGLCAKSHCRQAQQASLLDRPD